MSRLTPTANGAIRAVCLAQKARANTSAAQSAQRPPRRLASSRPLAVKPSASISGLILVAHSWAGGKLSSSSAAIRPSQASRVWTLTKPNTAATATSSDSSEINRPAVNGRSRSGAVVASSRVCSGV